MEADLDISATFKKRASPISESPAFKFEIRKTARIHGNSSLSRSPQSRHSPYSPTDSEKTRRKRPRIKSAKSPARVLKDNVSLESDLNQDAEIVLVTLKKTRIKTDRETACSFAFIEAGEVL
jgi:hypothetical protein